MDNHASGGLYFVEIFNAYQRLILFIYLIGALQRTQEYFSCVAVAGFMTGGDRGDLPTYTTVDEGNHAWA